MVSIDDDYVKIMNVLAGDKYFCKNWRSLCKALKFENDIMHDLNKSKQSSSTKDIIIDIFGYWKSTSPNNYSTNTLIEKLREMGCDRSAGSIESLCGYKGDIQGESDLTSFNGPSRIERVEKKMLLIFVAITGLMGAILAGILLRYDTSGSEKIESPGGYDEDIREESGLIWLNVRQPTRYFTGRETEMELIEKQWVESVEKKMMLFVAITGLGGIGKSELAANYAKHFHESTKGHCIWINAESNQTLLQSFQNLANAKLKIPLTDQSGQEKELNLLLQQIHAKLTDTKCLYIFDNLESYEQPTIHWLKELSSKQSPSVLRPLVLMTSRYRPAIKYFGNNCKPIQLDVLKNETCFKFFWDTFDLNENENCNNHTIINVIQKLCERLDCFPLAMQQAAAYINENLSHGLERDISEVEGEVAEYLQKLEIQTKKLLSHKIPYESHTTYLTWGITFEKICKMPNGGMEAIKLMNIISCMSPDHISIEFLQQVLEKMEDESESKLESYNMLALLLRYLSKIFSPMKDIKLLNRNAVQILHDHSMVIVQQQKSLSVHRLVQEVIRIKLKEEGEWMGTLDHLLLIVQEMMAGNEIKSDQLIHAQKIWNHATENVELIQKRGVFPYWVTEKLRDAGKYRDLFDFSCQALNTLESTLGENHRWTLRIKCWKGQALFHLGEYVNALEVSTEVYEKEKGLFGEEDGDSLDSATQIGLINWSLEEYDEALKWFRDALEKRERIFGNEHPGTLDLKHNIALLLDGQGEYEKAMELFQQVLEVRERVWGKEDLVTLMTKHNVATIKFREGNYTVALKMFLEVLEVEERVLEMNHPSTLTTKYCIADSYRRLGREQEALQLFKEVLEKREQILGPEHPHTTSARNAMKI